MNSLEQWNSARFACFVRVSAVRLSPTRLRLGDFESARRDAMHGVQIWRSGGVQFHPEDVDTPVVGCLCYKGGAEWHLGEIASCQAMMNEAISVAKKLKDMHALALALGSRETERVDEDLNADP